MVFNRLHHFFLFSIVLFGTPRRRNGPALCGLVRGFALVPTTTTTTTRSRCPRILFGLLEAVNQDDDEISQSIFMANAKDGKNMTQATTCDAKQRYRPIEDWHQENQSPTHVSYFVLYQSQFWIVSYICAFLNCHFCCHFQTHWKPPQDMDIT